LRLVAQTTPHLEATSPRAHRLSVTEHVTNQSDASASNRVGT
jgi:hypothetical protein